MHVLVVEDDLPSLELLCEFLASMGVNTRPVNDSLQAATLIDQTHFDGIFLDLMMPNLDGFELARRVRKSEPNRRTPIVIVTARDDKRTLSEAFAAGASFLLFKPLDKDKLAQLVNMTPASLGPADFPEPVPLFSP